MLSALKFVQGAVAKKDYQPALTHFRISDHTVKGYNGVIALSSPIDLDLQATPKAIPFVKAIERCEHDTTVVHLTPAGKLALRSGKFRAYIDCFEEEEAQLLDSVVPEGKEVRFPSTIVDAMRALEPFIGNDASRPWCNGILFRGHSAYATNNIIVAEYWLGQEIPVEINLPSEALRELIRLKVAPERIQVSENNITFHYAGGKWMRSQLLGTSWPDLSKILGIEGNLAPFPEGFFSALETVAPFLADERRVFMRGNRISTSSVEGEGASVEIDKVPEKGAYHYDQIKLLEGTATKIDLFKEMPYPTPWQGNMIRGVILGMVDT